MPRSSRRSPHRGSLAARLPRVNGESVAFEHVDEGGQDLELVHGVHGDLFGMVDGILRGEPESFTRPAAGLDPDNQSIVTACQLGTHPAALCGDGFTPESPQGSSGMLGQPVQDLLDSIAEQTDLRGHNRLWLGSASGSVSVCGAACGARGRWRRISGISRAPGLARAISISFSKNGNHSCNPGGRERTAVSMGPV